MKKIFRIILIIVIIALAQSIPFNKIISSFLQNNKESAEIISTGNVVYESSNIKALKTVPFLVLLIIVLVIAGLWLLRKKDNKDKTNQ